MEVERDGAATEDRGLHSRMASGARLSADHPRDHASDGLQLDERGENSSQGFATEWRGRLGRQLPEDACG